MCPHPCCAIKQHMNLFVSKELHKVKYPDELRMNILPSNNEVHTSSLEYLYVLGISNRMVKFEHEAQSHACQGYWVQGD